jgi:putative membrane protein
LALGLAVLPSLYAWFNIYANWDPYGATGNMKVAVVISDEGFKYRILKSTWARRLRIT